MKANPLGDIRAEADHEMLGHAFVETPDYKTLIGGSDRPIVVGRRGSGKSALSYRLTDYWREASRTHAIVLAPEEDQMIGLRPLIGRFGTKFSLLRAACRIAWRYALLMEIASDAARTYRFPDTTSTGLLRQHTKNWCRSQGFSARLRSALQPAITRSGSPEDQIANLPAALQVNQVQDALVEVMPRLKTSFVVLIDKLDEGLKVPRR